MYVYQYAMQTTALKVHCLLPNNLYTVKTDVKQ